MKPFNNTIAGALAGGLLLSPVLAAPTDLAASATNDLGIELYQLYAAQGGNLCLSPFSIQSAFAMTANGANGKTLQEMQSVLHYPASLSSLNDSFSALLSDYAARQERAARIAGRGGKGKSEPNFQLMVTNRLFGQKGYPFAPAFLKLVENSYHAPLQFADFAGSAATERKIINQWVEQQTHDKIVDLLPDGSLSADTRLVLVNALYFKAAWQHQFKKAATKPAPFHLQAGKLVEVPTMHASHRFGYLKEDGYTAVTLPYSQGFSMLVIVPDDPDGLHALDRKLTAKKIASLSRLRPRQLSLYLPKFKIEGGTIALKNPLQKLGMKLAFSSAANFQGMISDPSLPGLFISDAYHKTFIAVDEQGTEAAAATAVVMERKSLPVRPEKPIEVRIDRPFFYAIMDTRSQSALFLGRVTDPR